MLLWWILTVPAFLFVTVDIWRTTPEANVLRWAFMILTAFTGPIGAFFYVLGCREPLQGMHERYVATRWRQVLGSTMHCAAGDGIGIIVGAAIGAGLSLAFAPDFILEYALGFGFGWAYFQAFAMRDMAGGSYVDSLQMTFIPELLSMNLLMTGMQLTSRFSMKHVADGDDPSRPEFWFIMSMALVVGFAFAYPMNWWLVARHMKHGMLTVRAEPATPPMAMAGVGDPSERAVGEPMAAGSEEHGSGDDDEQPTGAEIGKATALSFGILAIALVIIAAFAL